MTRVQRTKGVRDDLLEAAGKINALRRIFARYTAAEDFPLVAKQRIEGMSRFVARAFRVPCSSRDASSTVRWR